MPVALILFGLLNPVGALEPGAGPTLSLGDYLEQVRARNPEARVAAEQLAIAELRLREAEVPFSPQLCAEYTLLDSRIQPQNAFSPSQTRNRNWKAGVKEQTKFGMGVDASVASQHSALLGVNPQFLPRNNYETTQLGLQLTQSLWRDSFGRATRAGAEARRAQGRKAVLDAKFKMKNLLLGAENTYWSLVSYGEVIKLQEENVVRARRLRDYMKQKVSVRLMDDVDFLQAQSSLDSRDLELTTSQNQRDLLTRQFNTLRGADRDQAETLAELPKGELLLKAAQDPARRMSREDFRAIFEGAVTARQQAQSDESQIAPQLDLVGGVYANGLSNQAGNAQTDAFAGRNPNWSVGLRFSVPLDYRLIGDMRRSYRSARRSAEGLASQAEYQERRAWEDLLKQHQEAQGRFERATTIESTQTELVKRERQRLLDGRSTTFQTINFEQQLAAAQIARVQAQLDLVQKHNLVKQFEETK